MYISTYSEVFFNKVISSWNSNNFSMPGDGNGIITNCHNANTSSRHLTIHKILAKRREQHIPARVFFRTIFNVHNTLVREDINEN